MRDHIESFIAYAERKHDKKVKTLRTDNAKEYVVKKSFVQELERRGIKMEQCTEYVHSQNGVAERNIGIITEIANCNMVQAGAPYWLWGEAVCNAIFVRNLRPIRRLNYRTPFELWEGRKPDITRLRPFGCLAIAHVPRERRQKFDTPGIQCIMLGYDTSKKAYRLLNPVDRTIVTACDVEFHETIFPFKIKSLADRFASSAVPGGVVLPTSEKDEEQVSNEMMEIPMIPVVSKPIAPVPLTQTAPSQQPPQAQPVNNQGQSSISSQLPQSNTRSQQSVAQPQQQQQSVAQQPLQSPPKPSRTLLGQKPKSSQSGKPQTFVLAKSKESTHDSGIKKMMEGFNPNNKRHNRGISKHLQTSMAEAIAGSLDVDDGNMSDDVVANEEGYVDEEIIQCWMTAPGESITFKEAMQSDEKELWKQAMDAEIQAFKDNDVYELVPRPSDVEVLNPNWVLTRKWDGRYKGRLTVNGAKQKRGIHFFQSFSSVLRQDIFRLVLCIMMLWNMIPYQYDVPNAFLQSPMDTPVYLRQPAGYVERGKEDYVWCLKKCVYGLKQASLMWRSTFHDFIVDELGLYEIEMDSCVYFKRTDEYVVIMCVYVDDFLLACSHQNVHEFIEQQLINRFRVKPLGVLSRYLGVNFSFCDEGIFLSQEDMIDKLVESFYLENAKSSWVPLPHGVSEYKESDQPFDTKIYRRAIGMLNWLAVSSRPDIAFAVSMLGTYQAKPTVPLWDNVKQVIKYLATTRDFGILLRNDSIPKLSVYVDASFSDKLLKRRSTSGYVFYFGSSPISWLSRRQHTVATSSAEAEFIAMGPMSQQALYLLNIVKHFIPDIKSVKVYADSNPALSIVTGEGEMRSVRHLENPFQLTRLLYRKQIITVKWVESKQNVADIMTKVLPNRVAFHRLCSRILTPICVPEVKVSQLSQ